jgi:hypothetical protein
MLGLADVLGICGRTAAADRATSDGLAFYDLKGNTAAAARARSVLGDRRGDESWR